MKRELRIARCGLACCLCSDLLSKIKLYGFALFINGKATAKSLPFFDKIQCNVEEICKTGTTTEVEDMLKVLDGSLTT